MCDLWPHHQSVYDASDWSVWSRQRLLSSDKYSEHCSRPETPEGGEEVHQQHQSQNKSLWCQLETMWLNTDESLFYCFTVNLNAAFIHVWCHGVLWPLCDPCQASGIGRMSPVLLLGLAVHQIWIWWGAEPRTTCRKVRANQINSNDEAQNNKWHIGLRDGETRRDEILSFLHRELHLRFMIYY